ncbi:MAG: hypothetical protein HY319_27695 [Armatimonadetes bacterium]|nr:hypothetical protein [Armatimonadota bacterium]
MKVHTGLPNASRPTPKPAQGNAAPGKGYPDALRVYVEPWDTGMAPNITGGVCTLATCKPAIRRCTKIGHEWILATGAVKTLMHVEGGKKFENWKDRINYAMVPDERLSYDDYFHDPRFAAKIPHTRQDPGDNLYHLDAAGKKYQAVDCVNKIHSTNDRMEPIDFTRVDLSAPEALVAHDFWYWGDHAPHLSETGLKPKTIQTILHAKRGHLVVRDPEVIKDVVDWLRTQKPGIHGQPRQRQLLSEFDAIV